MRSTLLLISAALCGAATAQTPPAAPAAAASAPVQRIEITGGRDSDAEQRRRATAARIVIGREEIEQYGDSTIGEVLRRLPGVTTPGTPGRGGPPRMRGLGSGYTQLLIDGQPIPRGFSLESLTPDQVERIEILRAPTAETGARAIAGTINVVLREGLRQRLNDLNLGFSVEAGEVSRGGFWTHNDHAGDLSYSLNAGSLLRHNRNRSTVFTAVSDSPDPAANYTATEQRDGTDRRLGLNLGARLQWRLGAAGDTLTLAPHLFASDNSGRVRTVLDQQGGSPAYDAAESDNDGRMSNLRLNLQWRQRLGPGRVEAGVNGSSWRSDNRSRRVETLAGLPAGTLDERSDTRENGLTLNAKYRLLLGGSEARPGSEHSLVFGGELESTRRSDERSTSQDGVPQLTEFGTNLAARSLRGALFAQNEWNPSPQWSLHAGLRWEGIRVVGDLGDGTRPENRSSVWTPLAHAVWKPDPASRSQVRASLTRSWRAPQLGNLIARPTISRRCPVGAEQDRSCPDRAGNPDLRPELATGIDLAWEHYPAGGGVFSASLFHRRIRDLMRSTVELETVSWSAAPRYVARTRNVGDAITQGLELEAKGRLDHWWGDAAPRVELRSNVSFFRSRVDQVPGPDNRLDQQAKASANLGADWRVPSLPLKTGASLNWVPGYETQVDESQRVGVSTRRVFDVYGLWTFAPGLALRLTASNALARDSDDVETTRDETGTGTARRTLTPSFVNWQLRLELKL